jgi:hypothetical protein
LTSLVIPSGVASIDSYTFASCSNLTNVALPATITNIGYSAFSHCSSLTALVVPDAVSKIESTAFEYCTSLRSIVLPKSLKYIDTYVFSYCTSLVNLTIPQGVTSIGSGAFFYCSNLSGVYFTGDVPYPPYPSAFEGVPSITIYYLLSSNYGNSTFNERPAVLWNPRFQTGDASFGVRSNRFGFNVIGTTNIPIVIDATTSATDSAWVPLQNGVLTNGLIYFSDPQWTNFPQRFYRIRSP